MTLPWPSASPNQYVYSSAIASWLSQVIGYDPAYGLEQDPEFYEKILRDTAIASNLDHLQKLVVGVDGYHQPRGDTFEDYRLANVLDELQRETEDLQGALYNLAAASWKGATWAELRLTRRILRLGDGKARVWWVIKEAKDADKRRFRLTRAAANPTSTNFGPNAHGGRPSAPAQPYKGPLSSKWRWEFNRGYGYEPTTSAWYVPLEDVAPAERWVLHRVDTSERGLAYGYGLADDLYFGHFAKGAVLKNLLQAIGRFGQGFLYQKVPGLRMGGPSGMTPEQKINAVVTTLRKYQAGNVYAIDKDDELELIDAPGEAIHACLDVVRYFDDQFSMRILAATRTMGGKTDGAFAQAKVEEGSSDANIAFLRTPLEERWSLTATRLMVRRNQANLSELGISPIASVPRYKRRGRKMIDPERAAVALEMAIKLRIPLVRREVYDLLEFSMPNPWQGPEEIIQTGELEALLEQRPEVQAARPQARERVAGLGREQKRAVGEGGGSVALDRGERNGQRRLVGAGR